ncbi:hypothetical protein BN2537_1245 [Streptomyces venezuelae]|nr:hypothetical protein BN2537_1245 [Streptomyces venezuelae]
MPETRARDGAPGFDGAGVLLGAGGFGLLAFALIEDQTYGWWAPLKDFRLLGPGGPPPLRLTRLPLGELGRPAGRVRRVRPAVRPPAVPGQRPGPEHAGRRGRARRHGPRRLPHRRPHRGPGAPDASGPHPSGSGSPWKPASWP